MWSLQKEHSLESYFFCFSVPLILFSRARVLMEQVFNVGVQ